jgi:hypothetical protein
MANVAFPISTIDYFFIVFDYVNGINIPTSKLRTVNAVDGPFSYIAIITTLATEHHLLLILILGAQT